MNKYSEVVCRNKTLRPRYFFLKGSFQNLTQIKSHFKSNFLIKLVLLIKVNIQSEFVLYNAKKMLNSNKVIINKKDGLQKHAINLLLIFKFHVIELCLFRKFNKTY